MHFGKCVTQGLSPHRVMAPTNAQICGARDRDFNPLSNPLDCGLTRISASLGGSLRWRKLLWGLNRWALTRLTPQICNLLSLSYLRDERQNLYPQLNPQYAVSMFRFLAQ